VEARRRAHTRCLAEIMRASGCVEPPLCVREGRLPTRLEFFSFVWRLSNISNPGYPYCVSGLKKRAFVLENFEYTYDRFCKRVDALSVVGGLAWKMGAVHAWETGLADPFLVLEKDEFVKVSKRDRQRNVIACAVVDELIDAVVGAASDMALKNSYPLAWSAVGTGFSGWRAGALGARLAGMRAVGSVSYDATGFEHCHDELDFRLHCHWDQFFNRTSPDSFWGRVAEARAAIESKGVLVFTDGDVWEQKVSHDNKSGTKKTSARNTLKSAAEAYAAGADDVIANGDDAEA